MKDSRWWLYSAGFVALMMVLLGVGNLVEDDGGPVYGRILFGAVLVGGASLVAAGIRIRPKNREQGSRLVAIGVLPGACGIAFFWFPPAVAVGVLALAASVMAFRDASGLATSRRAPQLAFFAVVASVAVLTVVSVGLS